FNFTFRVNAVRHQAEHLANHSWEYGTTAEAVMELVNPEKSVFGSDPFKGNHIPYQALHMDQALIWVYQHIEYEEQMLYADEYSVSDPASLGVAAVMVGTRWSRYLTACERQKEYLLDRAPRYSNGAISHRQQVAELWSDAVSMFPPFLAYYGVYKKDLDLLREAVRQIELYRNILSISDGPEKGLWKHIVGPSEMADEGAWSTGNGWAAYGMARVRATISGWNVSREAMQPEMEKLDGWIGEIIDGAVSTDDDQSGLLRNYLGDRSWWGEVSGTALLTAATYRMALFRPEIYAQPKYMSWASAKRHAVTSRVDDNGFAEPAVNALKHDSREPMKSGSEGAAFMLMLGSAWRDCVCRGV
ncbi:hypothetical protein BAUCODRAFT_52470, partial [Baudoinia panamericana UAMH 10762]